MKCKEKPLVFPCGGETLVGILARTEGASSVGVVIVVGGPQYRSGSHRQFVSLARTLAGAGYPTLRFDCRGMGDSGGEMRSFEALGDDIGAAIGALMAACPEVSRVALWGLCDGASAALLYWGETRDPRVDSLMLANPWVRSEASLARTQVKHYYGQRLLQPDLWKKILRGELALGRSIAGLLKNLRLSYGGAAPAAPRLSFQARMAETWRNFPGRILLLLSGQDYVAKEFLEHAGSDPAWAGLLDRPSVRRTDFPDADHTFSALSRQRQMELAVCQWLQQREWEGSMEEGAARLAG